eukprot:GHRR01013519.1.p1 GENE.GHRR01013519.1~~GHRR01013519.1.p1  ORF type:complete len:436 (+),score=106.88 GHRR01013519.1:320-1627(+)
MLSALDIAGVVVIVVLFIVGSLVTAIVALVSGMVLLVRPWDGNTQRDHNWMASTPFPFFWMASWAVRAAEYVVALKPGPIRAAELAIAYTQSQVLFALNNLGVPDALSAGPLTAAELAVKVGPHTPVDWLERVLACAAAYGMLKRSKCPIAMPQTATSASPAQASHKGGCKHGAAESQQDTDRQRDQQQPSKSAGALCTAQVPAPVHQYALNGVSAALVSSNPANMSAFLKLFEDHYAGYQFLSEGLKIGKVPFELWSGGKTYWQHIKDSPRHAATFNTAMHQINQIGGTAVANSRVWRQFDHVIDVAGGVGGFMADILDLNLHLRGVVFDQASQIESAHKVWRATHRRLMPRVELIAGDMFDPSTLPSPSDSSCKVAYTLRNILHDWSDTDSVAILKAIRSRISAGNIALGLVKLLIIEVTTVEEVLPCLMGPR